MTVVRPSQTRMEITRPLETRMEAIPNEMVEDFTEDSSRPAPSAVTHKRSREPEEPSIEEVSKKRKLKSDYCPAENTSWKPDWLETTQCYPVDQKGEDMSDVDCLQGDDIHRNAELLQRILENECMYIPNHRIDEMMTLVEETYDALKSTKEYYDEHPITKIRIEKHKFTETG